MIRQNKVFLAILLVMNIVVFISVFAGLKRAENKERFACFEITERKGIAETDNFAYGISLIYQSRIFKHNTFFDVCFDTEKLPMSIDSLHWDSNDYRNDNRNGCFIETNKKFSEGDKIEGVAYTLKFKAWSGLLGLLLALPLLSLITKLQTFQKNETICQSIKRHIVSFNKNNPQVLWTIGATFIFGVFISLYMFTQKLTNLDDASYVWYDVNMILQGRWFLFFPSAISTKLSMPFINGILGIAYLAISVGVIVYILKIKSKFFSFLIGAIMASFPSIACTFTYMFLADSYMFSIMLISFSVLAIDKIKFKVLGIAVGAILVCLSLGIYQAYLPFGLALCLCSIIYYIVIENISNKELVVKSFKYGLSFLIGLFAYFLINDLVTKGYVSSYQGIDEMGQVAPSHVPMGIVRVCLLFFNFFIVNGFMNHYEWQPLLFILGIIISLILLLNLAKKNGIIQSKFKSIMLILIVMVFPFTTCLIELMIVNSDKSFLHNLMVYALVANFILLISIAYYSSKYLAKPTKKGFVFESFTIIIVAIISTFIFRYTILTNATYTLLDISLQQAYADAVKLTSKIESLDDYKQDDVVVFVGRMEVDYKKRYSEWMEDKMFRNLTGAEDQTKIMTLTPVSLDYVQKFTGFQNETYFETYLEENKLETLYSDIENMPIYPNSGSIKKLADNIIIVKFEELTTLEL